MGKHRYGVVLDAGSSGTRLHVYKWKNAAAARDGADDDHLSRLPKVKTDKDWTMKVKPGISTFAPEPHRVGPDHLKALFDHALSIVPKKEIDRTPIFLLATAGVRLLPERQRNDLLAEVCSYAQQHTNFQLPDCGLHIQAISGETEGLYGWLSANYLLGAFDKPASHAHGKGHTTYGFLDLGGASAQIAFAPNTTEAEKHGNDLKLLRLRSIDGKQQEHRVFVTTYLGYGVNEARRRYLEDLKQHHNVVGELPDPCLPKGMRKDVDIVDGISHVVGTGVFSECLSRTLPLLEKDAECDDPPCLFNGVHVPAIDFDVNHFVGVSEYWHTTHEIFEMGYGDNAYNFQKYQKLVVDFCTQDWASIQQGVSAHKWGAKVDEERAADVCFKASWLINLLHDGIGIPRLPSDAGADHSTSAAKQIAADGYLAPFQAVNKIDNVEVSWTLGKMVLYAASQVPPASDADLAVGFGANTAGVPVDFNYAGGTAELRPLPDDLADDDDDAAAASSPLLDPHAFARRTPGILLIALILAIVFALLLGRERRAALLAKLSPFGGRSRRLHALAATLPFGLGARLGERKGRYERLLEEGADPAGDPATGFELGAVSSSSAGSSDDGGSDAQGRRAGRKRFAGASGPASRTGSPRNALYSPSGTSTVGLRGAGGGGGAGGGYFGDFQAAMRGDSRERDVGVGTGHRSRGQSPSSRLRSPLFAPYKTSVD